MVAVLDMKILRSVDEKVTFNFERTQVGNPTAGRPAVFALKDLYFNIEPRGELTRAFSIWCGADIGFDVLQVLGDMRSNIFPEMFLERVPNSATDQKDENHGHYHEQQDQFT